MKHALIHNGRPKTHGCARLISAGLVTQAFATRFQLLGKFDAIRLQCGPGMCLETKHAGGYAAGRPLFSGSHRRRAEQLLTISSKPFPDQPNTN